jgi:hypothetical protein
MDIGLLPSGLAALVAGLIGGAVPLLARKTAPAATARKAA